jgi:SAM-dependent methyltransferase
VDALELGEEPRRLLDVPCGHGRHAVALAALGHAMTGVDFAVDNRARAEKLAADAGVAIEFLIADMRALAKTETLSMSPSFDGAYCMGNSFGYFPRPETQQFLESVAQVLAPGARFVVDTASAAESILLDLHRQWWTRVDDELTVLLECAYDPRESRLATTYTSVLKGQVVDQRVAHNYVFTSGEILHMLDKAGFTTRELLSDLDDAPFELGSDRLLLIAERR